MSEKIILLDDDNRNLRLRELEVEGKIEALGREKGQLLSIQEELRAEVTDKMTLLDEFEDRFNRQYR